MSPSRADEAAGRRRRNRRRVAITILSLTAYVLSIGPMFWVWHYAEHFSGEPLIRVFYAPLRLLCGIEFIEELLNRYINWWIL